MKKMRHHKMNILNKIQTDLYINESDSNVLDINLFHDHLRPSMTSEVTSFYKKRMRHHNRSMLKKFHKVSYINESSRDAIDSDIFKQKVTICDLR